MSIPMPPDNLNEIGVLKRREIEARVLMPVLEALGAKFGHEQVFETVRKVIIDVARAQGKELAGRMGGDTLEVARRLNAAPGARYLLAATFGNVHGVYKPGQVTLKPSILKDCQDAVVAAFGEAARFYLVFHGGSGSELRDIHEALDFGVVKMNVDTDMQYAFTRAIADHCFRNYDGVLRVDGEVGSKKAYDPRSYLALAETAMAKRVEQAVIELRAT